LRAALDWYQAVYAYHLPPANRKIYRGLEEAPDGVEQLQITWRRF
jgi:hypothetical protein